MPSEGHQANTTSTRADSQAESRNLVPSAGQKASPDSWAHSAGRTTRPYDPKAPGMHLRRFAETEQRTMEGSPVIETLNSEEDELRARWLNKFANTGHTEMSGVQPDGRTADPRESLRRHQTGIGADQGHG